MSLFDKLLSYKRLINLFDSRYSQFVTQNSQHQIPESELKIEPTTHTQNDRNLHDQYPYPL